MKGTTFFNLSLPNVITDIQGSMIIISRNDKKNVIKRQITSGRAECVCQGESFDMVGYPWLHEWRGMCGVMMWVMVWVNSVCGVMMMWVMMVGE